MVGEHAYGVIFGCGVVRSVGFGNPTSLLGCETGDGSVDRDEPLSVVVGGAELGQQNGLQGRRWTSRFGCLREGERREEEDEKDSLEGHDGFLFPAADSNSACERKRVAGMSRFGDDLLFNNLDFRARL